MMRILKIIIMMITFWLYYNSDDYKNHYKNDRNIDGE